MFKKLNEELTKLLEGEVVSFQDFKNKKQGITPFKITIKEIELFACEGRIDGTIPLGDHTPGRKFTYEQFQDWLYKNDYFCMQEDEMFKCNFKMVLDIERGPVKQEQNWNCRFDVGNGNQNIFEYIKARFTGEWRGVTEPIEFTQEEQKPGEYSKDYEAWEHKKVKEEPKQDNLIGPQGYSKKPSEVALGDILYCSWGYSMRLVNFYRVIDVKKASIKLEKLAYKVVEGDASRGRVVPVDVVEPSKDTDGKLFRINKKEGYDFVCKVPNGYVEYWDGNPKSIDTWD